MAPEEELDAWLRQLLLSVGVANGTAVVTAFLAVAQLPVLWSSLRDPLLLWTLGLIAAVVAQVLQTAKLQTQASLRARTTQLSADELRVRRTGDHRQVAGEMLKRPEVTGLRAYGRRLRQYGMSTTMIAGASALCFIGALMLAVDLLATDGGALDRTEAARWREIRAAETADRAHSVEPRSASSPP